MTAHAPPRAQHVARKCDACGLRFPVAVPDDPARMLGAQCPGCGAPTTITGAPYVSVGAPDMPDSDAPTRRPVLQILLDNVRSLRNVGSIFRNADGAGIEHIHLAGITPTPDHLRFAKTALGAERTVHWTHHRDALAGATHLLQSGYTLWAIDGGPTATSLFAPEPANLRVPSPLVLIFGHEVSGIDPRLVALCTRVIYLPMLGHKTSLNVSVAAGIVAYTLRFGQMRNSP